MKITSILLVAAALLLAACGHDYSMSGSTTTPPPSSPPPSTTVNVTTSQLLTQYAQQTSETAEPFAVNGGAFSITDTSDSSESIPVSTN